MKVKNMVDFIFIKNILLATTINTSRSTTSKLILRIFIERKEKDFLLKSNRADIKICFISIKDKTIPSSIFYYLFK